MKKFEKKVYLSDRQAMVCFLRNHERYDTANAWSQSTSYANNMKIHHLGFDMETTSRLFSLIECDGAFDSVNNLIWEFNADHGFLWQAGFNGRSSGYLVLYKGCRKPSGYKSFCRCCGQANYTSVTETGDVCGHCGKKARVDFSTPPLQTVTYFSPVDMDEDFSGWDMDALAERVQLVCDFDRLADAITVEALHMAENYCAEEETAFVPQKRKILKYA